MRKISKYLLPALLLLVFSTGHSQTYVKVGISENAPLVYSDGKGNPKGIFVEILQQIAAEENWELLYRFGTFNDCLKWLESGEIHIKPDLGFSESRARKYMFNNENVMSTWAAVYAAEDQNLSDITSLQGKRIAVVQNDLLVTDSVYGFYSIASLLGIHYQQVICENYSEVFAQIDSGMADAGIVNRLFGDQYAVEHPIQKTPIIFSPISLRYAFSNNSEITPYLKKIIDTHLVQMKSDNESVFYKSIAKYYADPPGKWNAKYISYVTYVHGGFSLAVLIALFFTIRYFRKRIKWQTAELRFTNENLERNRENLSIMLDSIADAVIVTDESGVISHINPAAEMLCSWAMAEATGKHISRVFNVFDVESGSALLNPVVETLRTGTSVHITHNSEYVTRMGVTHQVVVNASPIRKKNQVIVGAILVVKDVTERYNIEHKLEVSENELRSILESMDDFVIVFDQDKQITRFYVPNQSPVEALEAEYVGKLPKDAFNPGLSHFIMNQLGECEQKKKTVSLEYSVVIDDNTHYFHANVSPRFGKEGYTGAVAVVRDISDLKKKEIETRKAKEKAEEADKLKSAFLANMSHEIRTPMNAIIGFSELMAEDGLTDDQRKQYSQIVNNNGEILLTLIDDIIDISKIEAGQLDFENIVFDLNSALRDLEMSFESIRRRKAKEHISLSLVVPDITRPFHFISDPNRLKQVLTNLIGNAIKFTEKGGVEFGYRSSEEGILFYVHDTGIGIPSSEFESIFNRFTQVDLSLTRRYEGTGLGLSISKAIVEMLGGKIWLESEVDKGTTFYFTITYQGKPCEEMKNFKEKTTEEKIYNWEGKTILVAEDHEMNYFYIEEALAKTKVRLHWVMSGTAAVEFMAGHPETDLVIMDLLLPELNGLEATRIIKKFSPQTPIVVISAAAMSNEQNQAVQAGSDHFMKKPVIREDLLHVLNNLLFIENKV
ncbi:MAG: PAS domain S-box protein [Bacteroidetes bacterium]|nr:PAS domain S-box protein [Bacteroidota bacterium]